MVVSRISWCTITFCLLTLAEAYFDPIRFPGSYCGTRAPGSRCCTGRRDECSLPIYYNQTRCYCDVFCDQRANSDGIDCCPDFYKYRSECSTGPPYVEPACNLGETCMQDCNKCTCMVSFALPYNPNNRQWSCTQYTCINDQTLISRINLHSDYYGWAARDHSKFAGVKVKDGKNYFLGTLQPKQQVRMQTPISRQANAHSRRSFDARSAWPHFIHAPMDQGRCACSWAFSAASVAADRWSIQSKGAYASQLSPQQLISCYRGRMSREACAGRHMEDGLWWLMREGVVDDECYPYTSGEGRRKGTCFYAEELKCPAGRYAVQRKTTPSYRIRSDEEEIMAEIEMNGPVQALMKVRPDFYLYENGVYRHTGLPMSKDEGHHSVKIIGWGVENNVKYWLAVNSWGRTWGEDGLFKIRRGRNESGIEEFVLAAWARVHTRQRHRLKPSWSSSSVVVHYNGK